MKLYTFANKEYKVMEDRFVNSLSDMYELVIKDCTFNKTVGVFSQNVWVTKTQMIIDAIKENTGDRIIVSDIDIQFFRPTLPLIQGTSDFLVQKEGDTLCIGFMIIRCNESMLNFFNKVLIRCQKGEWDQKVINEMKNEISWEFLPEDIWGWKKGENPPLNIAAHHATFAFSLEEKLAQMDYIVKYLKIRDAICADGLQSDAQKPYGIYTKYDKGLPGIWQYPDELTKLLLLLNNIDSFLEIGTWFGHTFNFISKYLLEMNPNTRCVTYDPVAHPIDKLPGLDYRNDFIPKEHYDFVLIDGDHHYKAIEQDYLEHGRFAKFCAFHDVSNPHCPEAVQYWNDIKKGKNFVEFKESELGIGVLINE